MRNYLKNEIVDIVNVDIFVAIAILLTAQPLH